MQDRHEPYEGRFNHVADFRVRYSFFTEEEGGRQTMPHQGYRSDFWYPNAKHFPSQIFMICPEFEDEEGQLILDKSVPVPRSGTARMWILIPKMRLYHQDKIQVRSKGYLMEGPNRVAECMVIQIMGLNTNPTQ